MEVPDLETRGLVAGETLQVAFCAPQVGHLGGRLHLSSCVVCALRLSLEWS